MNPAIACINGLSALEPNLISMICTSSFGMKIMRLPPLNSESPFSEIAKFKYDSDLLSDDDVGVFI
jgi:hypothetical protein